MNAIIALVAKDLRVFWKDKTAVILSFLVPMVLITIFGMVFGGGGGGPSGIRLLVVDEAGSGTSAKLIEMLQAEDTFRVYTKQRLDGETFVPMDRAFAREQIETNAGSYRYALILPDNLLDEDFGLNLELIYNPQNSIENNIVQGILQKTLFTKAFPLLMDSPEYGITDDVREAFDSDLAEAIATHFGGDAEAILKEMRDGGSFWGFGDDGASGAGETSEASLDSMMGGVFNIEEEQVFGENKNPASQSVGGWAVMFLLFSLNGAASSLFEERDRGLFMRILSGPAKRSHVLLSKFAFCSLLGFSQMCVLILFGEVVFDIITSARQIFPLVVVSLAAAMAATAFGMLLASLAKTPAQANGLGSFVILAMSAFGGAMFPLFMIPEFIRTYISPFSIVYWAMDGLLGVLWRDASILEVLPQVGVLLAVALGIMAVANWRFKKGDLFR